MFANSTHDKVAEIDYEFPILVIKYFNEQSEALSKFYEYSKQWFMSVKFDQGYFPQQIDTKKHVMCKKIYLNLSNESVNKPDFQILKNIDYKEKPFLNEKDTKH